MNKCTCNYLVTYPIVINGRLYGSISLPLALTTEECDRISLFIKNIFDNLRDISEIEENKEENCSQSKPHLCKKKYNNVLEPYFSVT